jgi:D-alanine-D-alanine ligase-like ATP-grasp enzyme
VASSEGIVGTIPRHYPYVSRMLLELFQEGQLPDVSSIEAEERYGYAVRITYADGGIRLTFGNDVGLNPGAACDVVSDKDYAKSFLRRRGVACPRGSAFCLPWWADEIRGSLQRLDVSAIATTDEVEACAEALGYPVYVKAANGSKGSGVWRCDDGDELTQAVADLDARRVKVALVEETIPLPDYRLVFLDGALISAYERVPLSVVGDGTSSIAKLLARLQERFDDEGRDTRIAVSDPRIVRRLSRAGLTLETVPERRRTVRLHDISNLSAGGVARDVTTVVAPRWTGLGAEIAHTFALRFCGVDLCCSDITAADADYSVLEVNAAPGLDHYAAVGPEQTAVVRDLYRRVFAAPATVVL